MSYSRDHPAHGAANLKQLEDTLAIDQTTLTRSLDLLERDGTIERVPHPDGRIKAIRLTSKRRRTLEAARPLWARAQDMVLRELGMEAWPDAQRRLAQLLRVAVETRRASLGQSATHEGSKLPPSATRGTAHGR